MLAELTQTDVLPQLEQNQVVYVKYKNRGYGEAKWRRFIHRIVDGQPVLGQVSRGEWVKKLDYTIERVRHIKLESRKIWKPTTPRKAKVEPPVETAKSNGDAWRKAALEALAKPVATV